MGAVKPSGRLLVAITGCMALATGAGWWWQNRDVRHFIPDDDSAFVASFPAPPAKDSPATRAELEELLALQASRTPAQVDAARADRKTEVWQFYDALGLDPSHPPDLPKVEKLARLVEDDVRIAVRSAKEHFRRLRPFEIEPRIDNCIDDVRADLSYPSGHAAFGWSMAYLLSRLSPEHRTALEARATSFARQRAVCGVHFPSDLAAGKAAARWLLAEMEKMPEFRAEADAAAAELQAALGKRPGPSN
jgi:acid phosphatase (class A)